MGRIGNWQGYRPPEFITVLGLLLFGILLTLPYSGAKVRSSPDGLYYEAQKREIQGKSAETARREVFSSSLAAPLIREESNLPPNLRRIDNPEWVEYSSQFYRRRWTVPVLAAAVDPIFGERSLEEVSLIGWALLPPLLYLLLRRRFAPGLSAAASIFCAVLPPLIDFGPETVTDTWGLTLLVAGLLSALLVRESGLRWLPVWIAVVLALSFTRDLTVVLVIAAGWLAIRERSREMVIVTISGALASLPAPLIFKAPVRDNLAYVFNDYRIPTDTSWGSILSDYPSQLSDLITEDIKYPGVSPIPTVLTLAMGAVVLTGLVLLVISWRQSDPFLTLIRAAAVGGVITILMSVNYTGLRLELVFVPAIATGLALLGERLLPRIRGPAAPQPAAGRPPV